jgi:hypothetical protein
MVVADRPASLQSLWCFIAMVRDFNWRDQYNCERFGAFTIIKGPDPVTYCGEGLLLPCMAYVALMQLIVAWHIVRGQLP